MTRRRIPSRGSEDGVVFWTPLAWNTRIIKTEAMRRGKRIAHVVPMRCHVADRNSFLDKSGVYVIFMCVSTFSQSQCEDEGAVSVVMFEIVADGIYSGSE